MPFKSANVGAVIFPPAKLEEEKRLEWLESARSALLKAFEKSISIVHEPEETPKDEADKVHHLHFYAWVGVAQNQNVWISSICDALKAVDIEIERVQVSVQPLGNDVGALRYLCHLDNPDKKKYPPELVKASSAGVAADFKKAIEATPKPSVAELVNIKTKTALAQRVGPENYMKYRTLWFDLRDEADMDLRIEQYRLKQGEIKEKARDMLAKALKCFPAGSEVTSPIYKLVYGAIVVLMDDD